MITKIISGGQSGADRGGLYAAKELKIPTGGYIPLGYLTEDNFNPELLKSFGLIETQSRSYPPRTRLNVINSDGTVIFGILSEPGSRLTSKLCVENNKPCFTICLNLKNQSNNFNLYESKLEFQKWLQQYKIKVLNIAGNCESKNPGIQEFVRKFLVSTLREVETSL